MFKVPYGIFFFNYHHVHFSLKIFHKKSKIYKKSVAVDFIHLGGRSWTVPSPRKPRKCFRTFHWLGGVSPFLVSGQMQKWTWPSEKWTWPLIPWSLDPLIPWSLDTLIPWSPYPIILIPWSLDPLILWSLDPFIPWSYNLDPFIPSSLDPIIFILDPLIPWSLDPLIPSSLDPLIPDPLLVPNERYWSN